MVSAFIMHKYFGPQCAMFILVRRWSLLRGRLMRLMTIFATICAAMLPAFSATLPAGFAESVVSGPANGGWNEAVGLSFSPSGRMFVWERAGKVWFKDPADASFTLLLDISEEVGRWQDHGLLGFAIDPNFDSNGRIYLLYVVDRHHLFNFGTPAYDPNISDLNTATIGRVTRYTCRSSDGFRSVDLATRQILVGETPQSGIPILAITHGIGSLSFGTDGTLLVSTGDGASPDIADTGGVITGSLAPQGLIDGIIAPKEDIGAFRSQLVDSLSGKVLRIDPVSGDGVQSNPFFDVANPRAPRSRVWSLGLRNPFRMSLIPNSGKHNPADANPGIIFMGDVGWNNWEALEMATRPGENFGWPIFEGLSVMTDYAEHAVLNLDAMDPLYPGSGCSQYFSFFELLKEDSANSASHPPFPHPCVTGQTIPASIPQFLHTRPVLDWHHWSATTRTPVYDQNGEAAAVILGSPESPVEGASFAGNCAVGGAWYAGSNFPQQFRNSYFFADWGQKLIKNLVFDANFVPVELQDFASSAGAVVCIVEHPLDGSLYYLSYGMADSGTIRKVAYTGNRSPVALASSDLSFGSSPLTVQLNGSASTDPDGQPLAYSWDFGDGSPLSTEANPSHIFASENSSPTGFNVTLTVTDSLGAIAQSQLRIVLNGTPPAVSITSPVDGSFYSHTSATPINLAATVSDNESANNALTYKWQILLNHNDHSHIVFVSSATETPAVLDPIGCDGANTYSYTVILTMTDPEGLSSSADAVLFPDCDLDTIAPEAPASITATAGNQNVELDWTPSTDNVGVTAYDIERCTGSGCENFEFLASANTAGYIDQSVGSQTIYRYRVRAKDAAGNLSSYSPIASVITPLTPRETIVASGINLSIGNSDWQREFGTRFTADASYTVVNASVWLRRVGNPQFNLRVRLFASNGDGVGTLIDSSDWIPANSLTTTYSEILFANGLSASLNNASAYWLMVECDGVGNSANYIQWQTGWDGSARMFYDSPGLDIFSLWDYLNGSFKLYSSDAPPTPDTSAPGVPATFGANVVNSSLVALSWAAATDNVGVTGYEIERCSGPGCDSFAPLTATGVTSFNDSSVTPETSYSYRVRARDAAGNLGEYSSISSVTTPALPPPPVTDGLVVQESVIGTGINQKLGNVSWQMEFATRFTADANYTAITAGAWLRKVGNPTFNIRSRLFASNGNGVGSLIDSSDWMPANLLGTTYTEVVFGNGLSADLVSGSTYWITIESDALGDGANHIEWQTGWDSSSRFYYDFGTDQFGLWDYLHGSFNLYSSDVPPVPDTTEPGTPGSVTTTAVNSGLVTLSWVAATDNVGVTGYEIERCSGLGCDSFAPLTTTGATSFNDTTVAPETSYSYRIRATDAAANLGGYSAVTTATTPALPPPPVTDGLVVQESVVGTGINQKLGNVSWQMEFATRFTADANYTAITAGAWLRKVGNPTFNIRVRLFAGNGDGVGSLIDSSDWMPANLLATTYSEVVFANGLSADLVTGSTYWITVESDALGDGANHIEWQTGWDGSARMFYDSPGSDIYSLWDYLNGSFKLYSSDAPPTPDTTVPGVPSTFVVNALNSSLVALSWVAATDNVGVSGYEVERCAGDGCNTFSPLTTTASVTSFNDTTVSPETSYSYRLRAKDAAGNLGQYSTVATVTTPALPPPPVTDGLVVQESVTGSAINQKLGNVSWQMEFATRFTADATYTAITAGAWLRKVGNPIFNIRARLFASNGNGVGPLIDSSDWTPANLLGTTYSEVVFGSGLSANLVSGSTYWLTIESDGLGDGANHIEWQTGWDSDARFSYDYGNDQFGFWDYQFGTFKVYSQP
jgi:glucose/arabinose dehydrogenase/chitodextrinase